MRKITLLVCSLGILFSGCSPIIPVASVSYPTSTAVDSATHQPSPTNFPLPSWTLLPSLTPAPPTDTPTPSPTPPPTETPTPTLTPTWAWQEPGLVIAPILLYHHIADNGDWNRYYVSIDNFRQQMQALHDWGYASITPSELVDVLVNGGELPQRPVVITFDDGNMDVYANAYPIMQEMGYVGAFYIVGNRMGADGFVGVEQLSEMIAAGWEVGSHSMTHADLTADHDIVREEILQSRLDLEEALSVTVSTIAYPFGLVDDYVFEKTVDYGYKAGMGLGPLWEHTLGTLYYLNRREVQYEFDLEAFADLLPWSEPIQNP